MTGLEFAIVLGYIAGVTIWYTQDLARQGRSMTRWETPDREDTQTKEA